MFFGLWRKPDHLEKPTQGKLHREGLLADLGLRGSFISEATGLPTLSLCAAPIF